MDRIAAVFVALAIALPALAGEANPVNVWTGAAPSGACKGNRVVELATDGSRYCCVSSTWAKCGMVAATPSANGTVEITGTPTDSAHPTVPVIQSDGKIPSSVYTSSSASAATSSALGTVKINGTPADSSNPTAPVIDSNGYIPAAVIPATTTNYATAASIDTPAASPSAQDDEFNGTTLDPKWSWVNQTSDSVTATATVANGALQLYAPKHGASGSADNLRILVQTAPSPTWEFTAKVRYYAPEINYNQGGLIVRDSVTGKLITCAIGVDSGIGSGSWGPWFYGMAKWSAPITTPFVGYYYSKGIAGTTSWLTDTFTSTAGGSPPSWFGATQYFRMKYDGSNITCSVSLDGQLWTLLGTAAKTDYMTNGPNQVGLYSNYGPYNGSTNLNGGTLVVDWFRRTDTYAPGFATPLVASAVYPDIPPSSPNAMNDEFNGPSLNPKWTAQYTYGSPPSAVFTGSQIIQPITADQKVNISQAMTPTSGDFSYTVKWSHGGNANYNGLYIYFVESGCSAGTFAESCGGTGGARIGIEFNGSGSRMFGWSTKNTTWSLNTTQTNLLGGQASTVYSHLQRTSGKYYVWYSFDGLTWMNLIRNVTHPVAGWATTGPGMIVLAFDGNGAPAYSYRSAVDWIRRDWLFLEP